ncbi:MOSC domain-containing protein [Roseomonas sp. BN140053]|uniref:MOSC domain-containing protein n=1 Tax=Roseomonas sp. BN140053 TaxID=3391898 RepID=UPI0039E72DE1
MLHPNSSLARLFAAPMRPGVVRWIGLRPGRREAMRVVQAAELDPEHGLVGDRYRGSGERLRQVTLLREEHLPAIAASLGLDAVTPEALRRNLMVSGINLLALKGRRFGLGDAVLESTGECQPCSRMEENLGPGGYNAVRGHGGITARVLRAGTVRLGDAVVRLDEA